MAYIGEGRRNRKVLAHDGYFYQKNRVNKDTIYWRCLDKMCRATLKTILMDLNNEELLKNIPGPFSQNREAQIWYSYTKYRIHSDIYMKGQHEGF